MPEKVDPKVLEGIWQDDLLDRRRDAEDLIGFLTARVAERKAMGLRASYVLNINCEWGHGKTFFMERLRRHLEAMGHWAVLVNAWESDFADDPLIAVMSDLDGYVSSRKSVSQVAKKGIMQAARVGGQLAWDVLKKAAIHQVAKQLGQSAEELAADVGEAISGQALAQEAGEMEAAVSKGFGDAIEKVANRQGKTRIEQFRANQTLVRKFKGDLSAAFAAAGKDASTKLPVFVLIDELDRCRPLYAIEMLERVKHLFDIDNVVFVIATDSGQLQHAIGAVYGGGFDAGRYLLRFFDRSYVFPEANVEDYLSMLFERYRIDERRLSCPLGTKPVPFFAGIMATFNVKLRDADQCFDILRTIITAWPFGEVQIEIICMFPLIAAFQAGRKDVIELFDAHPHWDERHNPLRNELAVKNPTWTIDFPASDVPHPGRFDAARPLNVMLRMVQLAQHGFPDILTANKERHGVDGWIGRCFAAEFGARFPGGGVKTGTPSVIQSYSSLIRSAGRLRQGAGTEVI